MNLCFIVPLAALAVYTLLLARTFASSRPVTRIPLLLYLISAAAWGAASVVVHGGFLQEHSSLLGKLLPPMGLWALVAYCHLVCSLTGNRRRIWLLVGLASVSGMAAMRFRARDSNGVCAVARFLR